MEIFLIIIGIVLLGGVFATLWYLTYHTRMMLIGLSINLALAAVYITLIAISGDFAGADLMPPSRWESNALFFVFIHAVLYGVWMTIKFIADFTSGNLKAEKHSR